MPYHELPLLETAFDIHKQYVRFRELQPNGYVRFDFAIGDPELAVELELPMNAYETFCKEHKVLYVTREQADTIDFEQSKWRFGAPGIEE